MSDHLLNDGRVDSGSMLEVIIKFIFWLLTTIVGIAVGLMVAWISPRI